MQKKKLVIANWKMNPSSLREARVSFLAIKKGAALYKKVEAGVAAPFVYLPELSKSAGGALSLCAQNVSAEKEGPYTGEVSVAMLAGCKTKYVIVGHSERRALGETNTLINQKLKTVFASKKMTPILCVGEGSRDTGMWYLSEVKTQIEEGLAGLSKQNIASLVIAYEPVWALSSTENRRDATPADSSEMIIYIRKIIADMHGSTIANAVRILYGGSVDEKNAGGFVHEGGADGLLVGKASLTPAKFIKILAAAQN